MQMNTNMITIEMLQRAVIRKMKAYQNGNYFAPGKTTELVTGLYIRIGTKLNNTFINMLIKMIAEFICQEENFSNFIKSKHRLFVLNSLLKYNKICLLIDNQIDIKVINL